MSGRDRSKEPAALGSEAFGDDPAGRPTGAGAFGTGDGGAPLVGSEAVGGTADDSPVGSEAVGGKDRSAPLRGALLFGNDPRGNPTGSEAVGGGDEVAPLRGALLFGNDPRGNPTGSAAFGGGDEAIVHRGSAAIGAPQLVPERLHRDSIGYDFVGRLLRVDESSLAGIRKDPQDRLRQRLLEALGRLLACEPDRLRHGLNEAAIPWGRLRRDRSLDGELAREARQWYRKAPGETLGIGHVRDLLEGSGRIHTFALRCDWDRTPLELAVHHGEDVVAYGTSAIHMRHDYFIFRDLEGGVIGYVDALKPRREEQAARVRDAEGTLLATVRLQTPAVTAEIQEGDPKARFQAVVLDADERPLVGLREARTTPTHFRAVLVDAEDESDAGRIEDRLRSGKIRTQIELDRTVPRLVAWGVATLAADLARLRRRGWPDVVDEAEEEVESIEAALGKPRSGS